MPSLRRSDDIALLDLGDGENRLHPDWMVEVEGLLDELEADLPHALVTVAGGKIWSNGLDVEWLGAHPDEFASYLGRVHHLFARLLRLPTATVAAVSGHAFGAGAMIALCHDARIMRADRGFFCLPEIDLGMSFTPGMNLLVQATLPVGTAIEAMTTGRRYGGGEAVAAGIVQAAVALEEVEPLALSTARTRGGKNGTVLRTIRQDLYAPVLTALDS